MSKHLILGAGNLGLDLYRALKEAKHDVHFLSRQSSSLGAQRLDIKDGMQIISDLGPEIIWNTVGAGGPTASPSWSAHQMATHYIFPVKLRAVMQFSKIINFSTHYLNHDPHGRASMYAMGKLAMEKSCKGDPNSLVIRIGSLYGKHKPMQSLPGKIVQALINGQEDFETAENRVSPTPTRWLAQYLTLGQVWKDKGLICVGPAKQIPIRIWLGRIFAETEKQLGVHGRITRAFVDPAYPIFSGSGVLEGPTSLELWEHHGPKVVRAAVEHSHRAAAPAPGRS